MADVRKLITDGRVELARSLLVNALVAAKGNVTVAREKLGLSRMTYYRVVAAVGGRDKIVESLDAHGVRLGAQGRVKGSRDKGPRKKK